MVSRRRPSTSSSGSIVFCRKAATMAYSACVSTVLVGAFGLMVREPSWFVLRHLHTVFWAGQQLAARALSDLMASSRSGEKGSKSEG